MRQVGTMDREAEAQRFASYLVTEGIAAHVERDGEGWTIWVRDENQVQTAKDAFEEFRREPEADRYRGVERAAESLLREEAQRREEARKNVVAMSGRWGRPGSRRRPLVLTMVAISVLVGLATKMGADKRSPVRRTLGFCDPVSFIEEFGGSDSPSYRLRDIRRGQVWRLITPIFLHGNIIHLAFNMIMFYQLGSMVEDRRGTWRIGLMILTIALISNAVQGLMPAAPEGPLEPLGGSPFFGGMSGVVYGLFGYIWMKTIYAPELGLLINRSTVIILMAWLFLCIAGIIGNVANWAHIVGLLVGVAIGYIPEISKQQRGR